MYPVRRIFSILLLVFFSLPIVSPLLAMTTDAEAGLPACCRRNGAHHCMMNMDMGTGRHAASSHGDSGTPHFAVLTMKCPYTPQAPATGHPDRLALDPASAIFAEIVSHPSGIAQTESRRRIAQDRSRQKRGPPVALFL